MILKKLKMNYKVHESSDVQTDNIGENSIIWQNCVILPGAIIGKNCNINFNVFIENKVILGDNITIKSGVQLWDGIEIEDNVQIGPNVTFTNDKYPRAKQKFELQKIVIKRNASVGAASVILGGVTIGENAMIGAGSLVTKDVPANELWFGSPAIFIRKI